MTSTVRPRRTRFSAAWMPASVTVSSALVASSSTRMGGFLSSVRAMATLYAAPR